MSQPEPTAPAVANQLAIENTIEIYKITADWIRFADAKAAVVLTVAGTLAGVLIPYLKPFLDLMKAGKVPAVVGYLGVACFAAWLALVVASSVYSFLCIVPYRRGGKHPALDACKHFHGAAIGAAYRLEQVAEFHETYKKLGHDDMQREVLAGILIDAHISNRKYNYVTTSIKLFFLSAVFGFLFLLVAQYPST